MQHRRDDEFGGIWSFIVGAQVACTLPSCAAVANFHQFHAGTKLTWPAFPTERYLTLRLEMDNEALAGERGVPDDGLIGVCRARDAYEALRADVA